MIHKLSKALDMTQWNFIRNVLGEAYRRGEVEWDSVASTIHMIYEISILRSELYDCWRKLVSQRFRKKKHKTKGE